MSLCAEAEEAAKGQNVQMLHVYKVLECRIQGENRLFPKKSLFRTEGVANMAMLGQAKISSKADMGGQEHTKLRSP